MKTSHTKVNIEIKQAEQKDKEELFFLLSALADYEKLPRPDKEAQKRLEKDIFGESPKAYVCLSKVNEKAVGYAFYFFTYSSFLAKPTFYLEDIFVLPEYRSLGIGKALFKQCVQVAIDEDCGRMEWHVLDWNQLAIDFYKKNGAMHIKEWHPFRLERKDFDKIVAKLKI